MSNCCFIIPIAPFHFGFASNFLVKMKGIMDVFLVFTDNNDYCVMYEQCPYFIPIILDTTTKFSGDIVTCKKFHALYQLRESHYDYFIVCDAEIDVIVENFTKENIVNKVESIFANKLLYGGECYDNLRRLVNEQCTDLFSSEDQHLIRAKTNNGILYMWWSDIPVYNRNHINDFFSKLKKNIFIHQHFDHVIYMYYLIVYHNFSIVNVTELLGTQLSLECYFTDDKDKLSILLDKKYGFSWAVPKFFHIQKQFLLEQGTFLLYHIDRYN